MCPVWQQGQMRTKNKNKPTWVESLQEASFPFLRKKIKVKSEICFEISFGCFVPLTSNLPLVNQCRRGQKKRVLQENYETAFPFS